MKRYPALAAATVGITACWLWMAALGCAPYREVKIEPVRVEYRGEQTSQTRTQIQNPQDAGKDHQLQKEDWLKKAGQTYKEWETAPPEDKDKIWTMYQRQLYTADTYGILAQKERELEEMFGEHQKKPKSLKDYRLELLTSPY